MPSWVLNGCCCQDRHNEASVEHVVLNEGNSRSLCDASPPIELGREAVELGSDSESSSSAATSLSESRAVDEDFPSCDSPSAGIVAREDASRRVLSKGSGDAAVYPGFIGSMRAALAEKKAKEDRCRDAKSEWEQQLRRELEKDKNALDNEDSERKKALQLIKEEVATGSFSDQEVISRMRSLQALPRKSSEPAGNSAQVSS
eukprot:TRINITY_DN50804_c0_g1_i1.p2 TRINITY_DN50804_c0_g1~~TRINITY_DN50804_c0_g1_i1.p2  ORF type:complete len:202 (+),score=42.45 TRINITY_DN50804_c0_g1_i1:34-639(+)